MCPLWVVVSVPAGPERPYVAPPTKGVGRFWTWSVPVPVEGNGKVARRKRRAAEDNPGPPRRRPRAAEGDLWRSCQMGGYCPLDIRNKYTQNTPADQILRWGSAGVYFGGLGIGTGSATEGLR